MQEGVLVARFVKRTLCLGALAVVAACLPAAGAGQAVSAWASVQFSPNPGTDNYLQGVAAISPTDAWSAGYYCRTKCGQNPEDDRSMILHWNGAAWSRTTC